MKKRFKDNKVLFVLATIIIISFVTIAGALIVYFYSGSGTDKYGNRLEGIEKHKIESKIDQAISDFYKETTYFNNVSVDVMGKIIYLTIDLKENLSLNDGHNVGIKALDAFTEEEKDFYDIQLIITTETVEEKSNYYPMMGYLNANSNSVVWTNND